MRGLIVCVGASLLTACFPCATRTLATPNGEWHRIMPSLLSEYGCGSFLGVASARDMSEWCVAHGLGETVASDVIPGCRPSETPGGCEFFWVCE